MADDFSLFDDLSVKPKGVSKVVDADSLFTHLGIPAPKDNTVIRDVPKDARPGPKGLMWNADGGYDPKTGELVIGGTPHDPSQGFLGGARAFVDGTLNGIPIVGPAFKGGVQRAAAIIASGNEPRKLSDLVAGTTPYDRTLKTIQQQANDAELSHPYAAGAGELAGGVAGYSAATMIPGGAYALGVGGAPMPVRMLVGGASNMLVGGTDAAVRGHDPVTGAVLGGVGGLAAPALAKGLGAGANKITDAVSGWLPTGIKVGGGTISRPAANILNRVLEADDPQAVKAALAQAGEFGMLADAGPSTRGLTGALAVKPGEGKTIVENALNQRAAGANDRIGTQLTDSLGPARDPALAAQEIAALRSQEGAAYQGVHSNAPPVDVSNVVASIDSKLATATGAQKTALQKIKDTLIVKPATETTPAELLNNSETLHNLRMDIDAVINHGSAGLGVEQGAVSRTQGALKDTRKVLDEVLKTQVPGMAEADAKSALLANRQGAVARGFDEVLGAKGPHPETYAAQRAAATPGENIAENIGIRGRVDRMFGTGTQRDAVTLNKLLAGGEDGYAAANLKTAFGDEPVNKLLETLNRERGFAATTNEVVQNSAKARRQAAAAMLEDATPGSTNLSSSSATGLALQKAKEWLVDPVIGMIFRTSSEPMKAEIARVLTAQGQTRDQILEKLIALQNKKNTVSKVGGAISNFADKGSQNLILSASGTQHPDAR